MHFLDCSAPFTVTQCSLKVRFFQVEIMLLRYEYDTLILGSGPMNGVDDPSLAKSSAISLPIIPSCPGTQTRVTWFICDIRWRTSLHSNANEDVNLYLPSVFKVPWRSVQMEIG